MNYIEKAAKIKPTARQIKWNQLEFYGFVHFGLYTYTDTETPDGSDAKAKFFNPIHFDAEQWVKAFKSAGMSALLLTCKHHEGFCLWPTAYTNFSVKNCPWKNGQSDIVKEVAHACKKHGLQFGVYLSPWDMHETTYGTEAYNIFFKNQLRELLTNYGDIFCVWFDGACRETKIKQDYDWDGYYALIRELQPNASICICGPDVRWCGNEAGVCRDEEWSVVPKEIMTTERNPGYWRQIDTIPNATWPDLGSREFISKGQELMWYPAEVDVSIRPSWGYVKEDDTKLHSLNTLMTMYLRSVGGNANLLLNVPPNPDGLFAEADIERLSEMGSALQKLFSNPAPLPENCVSSSFAAEHEPEFVYSSNRDTYWQSGTDDVSPALTLSWDKPIELDMAVIQETIEEGQHIESFDLDYLDEENHWKTFFSATTIGYKRICQFSKIKTKQVRFKVNASRSFAAITYLKFYQTNS
ncbi:alpha-L-fucosidase [Scatolibacter rhodanostii]|uniref:alpha-L-fucosidase n=1 Tax=Scatolibacter rhodanostii TaxID=2014781 RepID=UPI000C0798FA|nr:alpha-L-fucosidase [Scatolibacter rhodanostii]